MSFLATFVRNIRNKLAMYVTMIFRPFWFGFSLALLLSSFSISYLLFYLIPFVDFRFVDIKSLKEKVFPNNFFLFYCIVILP